MNANLEPGFLIIDFCRESGRLSVRDNEIFDDETDLEPFLMWIAADPHRAGTWADLRRHFDCDDTGLIDIAMGEPQFGWEPVEHVEARCQHSDY